MSRIRQTREQLAGKQNTSKTITGYYGGKTSGMKKSKKKGNPRHA